MATKAAPVDDYESDVIEPGTWGDVAEKDLSGDFPVLPRGIYPAYLADHEVREGQESGNEYLSLEFLIEKDEEAGVDQTHHVWDRWFFSAKAMGITKAKANALGVEIDPGTPLDEALDAMNEALHDYHTAECRLRLKVVPYKAEDDNGNPIKKVRNEIQRILPA